MQDGVAFVVNPVRSAVFGYNTVWMGQQRRHNSTHRGNSQEVIVFLYLFTFEIIWLTGLEVCVRFLSWEEP